MAEQRGAWGGARSGAGNPEFKPKWKSGKTTVIRVPEAIADEVLAVARQIDEGSAVTLSSASTTVENERLREQIREYQEKLEKLENSTVTQSSQASLEKIRDRVLLTHSPKDRRKLKTVLDQFISLL
jgi:cell shape-determining protein MreC